MPPVAISGICQSNIDKIRNNALHKFLFFVNFLLKKQKNHKKLTFRYIF